MATFTVTNTFVANTKARAAEVNQNFTDVLLILRSHHHDPNIYTNASPITNSGIAANAQILDTQLNSPITRSGLINDSAIQLVTIPKGGTGLMSLTAGDIIYGSSANRARTLPIGAANQVLAVSALGFPNWISQVPISVDLQTFTASGTWTKPAGISANAVTFIKMWGGGGAGGGCNNANQAGGGGGGGAYVEAWIKTATLAATVAVTVPAAAVGVNQSTGTVGGTVTFGALLTAAGGAGGGIGGGGAGGAGGAATSGFVSYAGATGGAGGPGGGSTGGPAGQAGPSGGGGSGGGSTNSAAGGTNPFYGGTGGQGNTSINAAGNAATGNTGGGGGGGGSNGNNFAGGNGATGQVQVYTIG